MQILEVLLANGADINAKEKLRGTTAPHVGRRELQSGSGSLSHLEGRRHQRALGDDAARPQPYLAPPGRERIQEFIDGTGLRGAIVEQDKQDTVDSHQEQGSACEKRKNEAKKRFDEEVAAAKSAVGRFPASAVFEARSRGSSAA